MSEEPEVVIERRATLIRHIKNVQDSCFLLGERLIKQGEHKIGHNLMANGLIHDNSKWYGIEWEYLHPDVFDNKELRPFLELAIKSHVNNNPHHPEYWDSSEDSNDGIHRMPRVYVAEMVCDWSARSKEFGNDLREWIKDRATKKFGMVVQSTVYKEIRELTNILLDPAFKVAKEKEGK